MDKETKIVYKDQYWQIHFNSYYQLRCIYCDAARAAAYAAYAAATADADADADAAAAYAATADADAAAAYAAAAYADAADAAYAAAYAAAYKHGCKNGYHAPEEETIKIYKTFKFLGSI